MVVPGSEELQQKKYVFQPNIISLSLVVRVNHPLPNFTEATQDTGM